MPGDHCIEINSKNKDKNYITGYKDTLGRIHLMGFSKDYEYAKRIATLHNETIYELKECEEE